MHPSWAAGKCLLCLLVIISRQLAVPNPFILRPCFPPAFPGHGRKGASPVLACGKLTVGLGVKPGSGTMRPSALATDLAECQRSAGIASAG